MRPRPPASAGLRCTLLAVLAVLMCCVLSPGRVAAAGPQPPTPRLSARLFPQGTRISGGQTSNADAYRLIPLHGVSWSALGRTGGYSQSVRWMGKSRIGRSRHLVTLRYVASRFASPADAQTALTDARATLWEIGTPLPHSRPGTFRVEERDGHLDDVAAVERGSVEAELLLRYGRGLSAAAARRGLAVLDRAAASVSKELGRMPTVAQVAGTTTATSVLAPAVFSAPWGTGPVVKSAGLIAAPSVTPAGMTIEPGAYRPATAGWLARRAVRHPDIAPTGSRSRFAVLPQLDNRGWYVSAALFASGAEAGAAFDALSTANGEPAPASLQTGVSTPHLASGRLASWQSNGDLIAAFTLENVVLTFAAPRQDASALVQLAESSAAQIPTPLHSSGVSIVDGAGVPVKLTCLNWYGAEENDFVVGGLDYRPYAAILTTISSLGYNCIRLPFSNQLVEQNPVVTQHVGANPELQGMHALDILDRIVQYAGALGLSVILDNHRSDAGWSAEPLWYTDAYPDTSWVNDWTDLAQRYAASDVVVGADLRNEPHGGATWGTNDPATDWRLAAERGGDAVLAANPQLLIMVEGVQVTTDSGSYWWGGNLTGVATAPVELHFADGADAHSRLVYAPHDYGPGMCGAGCPWFGPQTTSASLQAVWEQHWGYITDEPGASYAAPLWLGEFGTCNQRAACVSDATPGSQGQWFSSLVQYLEMKGIGWSYWAANGTQSTAPNRTYGATDWYGVLSSDWTTPSSLVSGSLAAMINSAPAHPGA